MPQVRIEQVAYDSPPGRLLAALRQAVFVQEQGVDPALEFDGRDAHAMHLAAFDEAGQVIGALRMLELHDEPAVKVGRVAVARAWRGRGVGKALMQQAVQLAISRGHGRMVLSAQTTVEGFYRELGFVPEGDIYLEAGIPHRFMWRSLNEPG